MTSDKSCIVIYSNGKKVQGRSEPLPYPKAIALSQQFRESGWRYVRIEFIPKSRQSK